MEEIAEIEDAHLPMVYSTDTSISHQTIEMIVSVVPTNRRGSVGFPELTNVAVSLSEIAK